MTMSNTVALAGSGRSDAVARARPAPWALRTRVLLVVALAAVTILAFARWQIAREVVPWDAKNHFYPMFRFLGDALNRGVVPLWNPYYFAGSPSVADPQSLVTTPTMALLALLWPRASMAAFDAMIFAHLLCGGGALLGLTRRWGWHPAAALLAALVFMFGGSAAARLQHTGMIISYSFFPAAVWSLEAALDRRSLRLAVGAGLCAALMALGRDQVAYLLCLTLLALAGRRILQAASPIAFAWHRLLVLLVAGFVTLAVTAVPILLTMQFLHGSNRPGIAFGMALEGSLDPVNLLTLVAPNAFGSLDRIYDYWGPGAATAAGNDWTDRSIDYLFTGTLPMVLLAWHGLAGGRALARDARFFALLTGCAFLYAFGRSTPLFAFAFDWLPGVSLYRRPADATFVANVGLALLGGSLLHEYIAHGLPRRPATFILALALAAATLLGAAWLVGSGLAFARQAGQLERSALELAASSGVVLAEASLLIVARQRGRRAPVALGLVLATAAQLVWFNAASPLNAEPASTYSAFDGLQPDQARGLAILDRELGERQARGEHPRVEILGLDGSWQNASMVLKLQDTVGYNPLRIAAYERAVGVGESAVDTTLRTFPDTFRGYNSRLAALLGLDYLILDRPVADLPRHIPRPRATLLFAGDRFFIYRLDGTPVPRVTVAGRLKPIEGENVLVSGGLPRFDPLAEALIEEADAAKLLDRSLLDPSRITTGGTAVITTYGENRVVVDVEAPSAGVVVLHDLVYPGWEACVDGVPAPLLRADLLFRGVEVGAGHHSVEFAFYPLALANLAAAAGDLLRGERHGESR